MAEKTDISWWSMPQWNAAFPFLDVTDAVRLIVLELVALVAKREPVLHREPQRLMFGEALDVVGAKVAAFAIATFLAGIFIAGKNGIAPFTVFCAASIVSIALAGSALPGWMRWPTNGALAQSRADFCLHLWRAWDALAWPGVAFVGRRDFGLGRFRMRATLESARSPLCTDADLYPRAGLASSGSAVISGGVAIEARARPPFPALPAPLFPRRNLRLKLRQRDSYLAGQGPLGTGVSLSHGVHLARVAAGGHWPKVLEAA